MKQNPQAVKDMLANDPDATVYLAFRPSMQQSLGMLKQIDQAKQVISSSSEPDEREQSAVAALDQARQQELVNTDKVDRAVDMVLQRVHQRNARGLSNVLSANPLLRSLRRPSESQP